MLQSFRTLHKLCLSPERLKEFYFGVSVPEFRNICDRFEENINDKTVDICIFKWVVSLSRSHIINTATTL